MRSFNKGAEAVMYSETIFGVEVIIKAREPKTYRIKKLDDELRRSRTKREAKIMSVLAGLGIKVPALLGVGMYSVYMERLHGTLLRDTSVVAGFYRKLGRIVRDMHMAGVVHGDLTPANIMITRRGIYVIDFGLAEITDSVEEKALDILLMKRSLDAGRYKGLLQGYSEKNGDYERILKRLAEIEKRGRYQTRTLI